MIDTLVAELTALSAQHGWLAYLLVGLLAMAEALPVVGLIVPGSERIVGISTLVPSSGLGIWPLVIAAIAGAVMGDGLSFWLGRRVEHRLVAMWPLRRYPRLVSLAEGFFYRHGGKGIFLARFVQGPRAFAGLHKAPGERWMLVPQHRDEEVACADLTRARGLGVQNSEAWWLVPGGAFDTCRGDREAAPLYIAPTTLAGSEGPSDAARRAP